MPRRFQPPPRNPTQNTESDWVVAALALVLFAVVALIIFWPDLVRGDHDAEDQAWRRPLLEACAAEWQFDSLRVTVDAPGHLQHGRSLHDQPLAVRDIFYGTWFRDTEDEAAVDAHLIQWRREYECTHPGMPVLPTVGGRLPRGGGGPVTVQSGLTPPPGYPRPTVTPSPTPEPTETPNPDDTPTPGDGDGDDGGRRYSPPPTGWKWHCHQRAGNGYGRVVECLGDWWEACDGDPHGKCDYRTHHRHVSYTHENPTPHIHRGTR